MSIMPRGPDLGELLGRILEPLAENVTKNYIMDTVDEPRVGSVVYCGFAFGYIEHSGIYVGRRKIVSLSKEGEIVKEDPQEFLNGITTGDTIYVSCKGKSPVGRKDVGKRARRMVGSHRDYSVLWDNCHRFTSGCLTDDFENADTSLSMLKHTAGSVLGADEWRAWALP